MKRIISLLLLACPILASATPDNDKAIVQAVIAKYYNHRLPRTNASSPTPPLPYSCHDAQAWRAQYGWQRKWDLNRQKQKAV